MSHLVALLRTRCMEDSASLLVGGKDIPFNLLEYSEKLEPMCLLAVVEV